MVYPKIVMSRILFLIISLLCATLFISCKTLLFKGMFGSVVKIENIKDYEGYWESDDGMIIAIKFLGDSSTIVTGLLDWDKDKEMFKVISEKSTITKIKDATFLNGKTNKNNYKITQFELWKSDFTDKVQLRMWDPDVDLFEKLVKNKELPGEIVTKKDKDGKVVTDSVLVDSLSEDELAQLMDKNNLFDYKNVQVLRRVWKSIEK